MKLIVVLALAVILLLLVRKNLLQVDITFPLFVGLVFLGFASMSDTFIHWTAAKLGIIYPPIAIILMVMAILFAIVTILAIAYSRLRTRQHFLVRYLAQLELDAQESADSGRVWPRKPGGKAGVEHDAPSGSLSNY